MCVSDPRHQTCSPDPTPNKELREVAARVGENHKAPDVSSGILDITTGYRSPTVEMARNLGAR